MQYVLIRWIRDEQLQAQTMRGECKEQDRKQLHIVTSKNTSPTKVNVPTSIGSQLVDFEHGTRRSESSLHCSERIAYERIARSLTPKKRGRRKERV
jgi:hypothetical protein